MFALRRSLVLGLSSRVSQTTVRQSRSITTLSRDLRICAQSTVLSVYQRRFASDGLNQSENQGVASQDELAPDTTSAGQFDASEIEPIEAKEIPQKESFDSAPTRFGRDSETSRDANAQVIPPSKQIYVGNIYFDVTEEDLRKEFSRFGTVTELRIIKDARGMSKGFAYISYPEQSEATAARDQMNRTTYEGRRLNVQYAQPRGMDQVGRERNKIREHTTAPPTRTLYIGNMSFDLSDQDLSKLFSGIRNVLDVRVAIDRRTGQPRGFAHADFTDVESAEAAFAKLNGMEVYGRTLRVDYSGPSSRVRSRSDIE